MISVSGIFAENFGFIQVSLWFETPTKRPEIPHPALKGFAAILLFESLTGGR